MDGMAKGRMVNGGYNKEGAMNWSNIQKYAMSLGNREITTKLYKKERRHHKSEEICLLFESRKSEIIVTLQNIF